MRKACTVFKNRETNTLYSHSSFYVGYIWCISVQYLGLRLPPWNTYRENKVVIRATAILSVLYKAWVLLGRYQPLNNTITYLRYKLC